MPEEHMVENLIFSWRKWHRKMLENEFSSLETRKETTLVVHITSFPKRGSPGLCINWCVCIWLAYHSTAQRVGEEDKLVTFWIAMTMDRCSWTSHDVCVESEAKRKGWKRGGCMATDVVCVGALELGWRPIFVIEY
jgi:hypothetical protein